MYSNGGNEINECITMPSTKHHPVMVCEERQEESLNRLLNTRSPKNNKQKTINKIAKN